ncbi:uncharacterized protein LOC107263529 [Cephus cinctus]|uniref:Uncharacterized protein LOC107263529 n=1 Tax=Cephus cinctus TaxID=211228 RepID=A0AAJ7BIG5_CEPCN|nr:uncharacterized protein LOC107263529 [Cephus cinctus]
MWGTLATSPYSVTGSFHLKDTAQPTQDTDITSSLIPQGHLLKDVSQSERKTMDKQLSEERERSGSLDTTKLLSENDIKCDQSNKSQSNHLEANKSLQEIFPWLIKFTKIMCSAVGNKSYQLLERLLSIYIENVSKDVNTCYSKPYRAAKLKNHMNNTLTFFHFYWQDVKEGVNDHSSYLDKMSEIVGLYMDMELKASKRGKDSCLKVAAKLLTALHIFLENSEEHTFKVLFRAKFITKKYSDIFDLIFTKCFASVSKNIEPMSDVTYVRYLLALKLWKKIKKDSRDKKKINELALSKLGPLVPNVGSELAKFIPKPPKCHKSRTLSLMQPNSFDLRSACDNFLSFQDKDLVSLPKEESTTKVIENNVVSTAKRNSYHPVSMDQQQTQVGNENRPKIMTLCETPAIGISPAKKSVKLKKFKRLVPKLKPGEIILIDLIMEEEENKETNLRKKKKKKCKKKPEWLREGKKKLKAKKEANLSKSDYWINTPDAKLTENHDDNPSSSISECVPVSENKVTERYGGCMLSNGQTNKSLCNSVKKIAYASMNLQQAEKKEKDGILSEVSPLRDSEMILNYTKSQVNNDLFSQGENSVEAIASPALCQDCNLTSEIIKQDSHSTIDNNTMNSLNVSYDNVLTNSCNRLQDSSKDVYRMNSSDGVISNNTGITKPKSNKAIDKQASIPNKSVEVNLLSFNGLMRNTEDINEYNLAVTQGKELQDIVDHSTMDNESACDKHIVSEFYNLDKSMDISNCISACDLFVKPKKVWTQFWDVIPGAYPTSLDRVLTQSIIEGQDSQIVSPAKKLGKASSSLGISDMSLIQKHSITATRKMRIKKMYENLEECESKNDDDLSNSEDTFKSSLFNDADTEEIRTPSRNEVDEFENIDILDSILHGDMSLQDKQEILEDPTSAVLASPNKDNSTNLFNCITDFFEHGEVESRMKREKTSVCNSNSEFSIESLPEGSLGTTGILNSLLDFELTSMNSPPNDFMYSNVQTVDPRLIRIPPKDENLTTNSSNGSIDLLAHKEQLLIDSINENEAFSKKTKDPVFLDESDNVSGKVALVEYDLNSDKSTFEISVLSEEETVIQLSQHELVEDPITTPITPSTCQSPLSTHSDSVTPELSRTSLSKGVVEPAHGFNSIALTGAPYLYSKVDNLKEFESLTDLITPSSNEIDTCIDLSTSLLTDFTPPQSVDSPTSPCICATSPGSIESCAERFSSCNLKQRTLHSMKVKQEQVNDIKKDFMAKTFDRPKRVCREKVKSAMDTTNEKNSEETTESSDTQMTVNRLRRREVEVDAPLTPVKISYCHDKSNIVYSPQSVCKQLKHIDLRKLNGTTQQNKQVLVNLNGKTTPAIVFERSPKNKKFLQTLQEDVPSRGSVLYKASSTVNTSSTRSQPYTVHSKLGVAVKQSINQPTQTIINTKSGNVAKIPEEVSRISRAKWSMRNNKVHTTKFAKEQNVRRSVSSATSVEEPSMKRRKVTSKLLPHLENDRVIFAVNQQKPQGKESKTIQKGFACKDKTKRTIV